MFYFWNINDDVENLQAQSATTVCYMHYQSFYCTRI